MENTGAAPTHLKVISVSQSAPLSRPRVLYIPCSVQRPVEHFNCAHVRSFSVEHPTALPDKKPEAISARHEAEPAVEWVYIVPRDTADNVVALPAAATA